MKLSNKICFPEDFAKVSQFYNCFPYPIDVVQDGPPPGFNWRWSVEESLAFCTGALPGQVSPQKEWKILDAGCGTGVSTDYLAHLNPGSNILAVDIAQRPLEIARERLKRSGGDKIAKVLFRNSSLFDLFKEPSFDYINSIGVIHHLQEPLAGLKILASLLKKGGIIHIYLYAESGRSAIKRIHKVLKSIDIQRNKKGIMQARELILNLPSNNKLRKDYEELRKDTCESDVNFADMYMHPRETYFSLQGLFELISSAGLEFVNFSNPNIWQLDNYLHGELLNKAKSMPMVEQFKLIELLNPDISHFEFFLSKGVLQNFPWEEEELLLATSGKISSCLYGWPGKNLYDSEMNQIELSQNSLKLLHEIQSQPRKPLGDLKIGLDKSTIASTARDLHKKQVLLLYPV